MIQHDDDQLAAWLANGPQSGPQEGLERALSATRATRQRPTWLVALRGGTIAAERTTASVQLAWVLITIVALMGLLAGGIVVGGWLRPQPAPSVVLPSTLPAPSSGLVAYTNIDVLEPGDGNCTETSSPRSCSTSRVWVVNADGTGAHELLPDRPGRQSVIAWSADGSRLLYQDDDRLMLTDASGSEPQLLNSAGWCEYPCAGIEGFALSPDGGRLAFVRNSPDAENSSVVATVDLATGRVTELESTYVTNPEPGALCDATSCDGMNDPPSWSPDGNRLVFARQGIGPPDAEGRNAAALFVVDADGGNLREISPAELYAIDPHWSPDGSRIAFISAIITTLDPNTVGETLDIYVVGEDGEVRRLTTDGISARPTWTRDGRIIFARMPGVGDGIPTGFELWIMDADGENKTQLQGDSVAELTAAGCIACDYPLPEPGGGPNRAVWQPGP